MCAIIYTHQTSSTYAGMCVCDTTHQLEKTEKAASNRKYLFLDLRNFYLESHDLTGWKAILVLTESCNLICYVDKSYQTQKKLILLLPGIFY